MSKKKTLKTFELNLNILIKYMKFVFFFDQINCEWSKMKTLKLNLNILTKKIIGDV